MEKPDQYSEVELYTNSLYSGMILYGNLCLDTGTVVYPANTPLTRTFITDLLAKGVNKVYYHKPVAHTDDDDKAVYPHDLLEKAYALSEKIGYSVVKRAPLPVNEINETVDRFVERVSTAEKYTYLNLAELDEHDEHSYFNSVNVALVSVLFGKLLTWSKENIRILGIGALLHDIGKLLVTKEILTKKGDLTREEFDIMKKHTTFGYSLLKSQTDYPDPVLKIVLMHHESWDGSGYPMGVPKEKIEDMPQIVSLCDFFVALTSKTNYREKFSNWKALTMIRKNSGVKFNPRYAAEFINRMPSYLVSGHVFRVGDFVELNTNEIGEVVRLSEMETLKPMVKIFLNGNGESLRYPLEVDLQMDNNRWIEDIIEDRNLVRNLKNGNFLNK